MRSVGKHLLALLAAAALSFLAGFAFVHVAGRLPCNGERLACNIDEAVGAYGVMIWAILGPCIIGVVLAVARNRTALLGATVLLLVPPLAFLLVTQYEHTVYIGFEPQRQLRTFLVSVAPVIITVLVQYLIMRPTVPRSAGAISA
ncbi:MAG: hypothetical protein FJX44_06645 [Alphaproteobacteria bacterium]|nr:hypothetical protein [Alphaproteobacteria bacterium]